MSDDLRARLTALVEAKDKRIAEINATPDPLTGRCSTMRAYVLTDELRALLAPAPASEPLGPAAEVSPSPKAAQSPASETARDAIERDLWWGHLCPALANIGALNEAQRELTALGTDWAQAGRILSRVQSFYVDAAHRAAQRYLEAITPTPTPPTTVQAEACVECRGTGDPAGAGGPDGYGHACKMCGGTGQAHDDGHECAYDTPGAGPCETCLATVQVDRDAGQVRLNELIEKYDGLAGNESARYSRAKDVAADLRDLGRALTARQSDPDATEREVLAKAWERGAYDGAQFQKRLHEWASPMFVGTHPEPVPNPYRRTVTTSAWTEVGE